MPDTRYDGPTYYGRAQLKPSPFEWPVALYIWLAGMSGSAQILATIADLAGGRRARGVVRRGRYLSLLGIVLGPILLVYDLHTPQRFYNMLRIAKGRSPMSIGTWTLSAFSLSSLTTIAAQALGDFRLARFIPRGLLRGAARAAEIPAAASGAGMSVYTSALMSATSTPLWAAAPRTMAVRLGSSSFASAACALVLAERRWGNARTARSLDGIALAALSLELAATLRSHAMYDAKGVTPDSKWERLDRTVVTGAGTMLPVGLYAASLLAGRRGGGLSQAASVCGLLGGLGLRMAMMYAGNDSARDPRISMGFAQPENLPAA